MTFLMIKSLIILLLFLNFTGFAQINSADSLKLLLKSAKEDTSIVLLLAELSESYLYNNPDTSFYFTQQGLALSRKINYIKGEASSLRNLGVIFEMSGDYPTALEQYFQALKKYESLNDMEGMIRIYADIGLFTVNRVIISQIFSIQRKVKTWLNPSEGLTCLVRIFKFGRQL